MALNWTLNECHIYKDIKLKKRRKEAIRVDVRKDIKLVTKALVISEPMAIFYARHRKS